MKTTMLNDGIVDLGRVMQPMFYSEGYPWETGYDKQMSGCSVAQDGKDILRAGELYRNSKALMLRDAIRHAEIQGVEVPAEAYLRLASMKRPITSDEFAKRAHAFLIDKTRAREDFVEKMVALHLADQLATPVLTRYSGLYCQVMGQHAGEPDIDYVRRCAAQSFDDANGLLDAQGEHRPLEAGDKVFVISEQRLATVLNTYGDGINGDCGDVRVDLCGNTAVTNLEHYDPVEHAQFDATFTPILQAWKEQYGITKDIPVRHEPVETEIPPERPRG